MKNPWLGLKSYEEGDHLYGRGKEADELANIVMNSFHTIIYGKSGIGKTSLLRAGVFPTLRYEDFLPIYIRLEHDENADEDSYLHQIENALKENQCSCSVETERAPSSGISAPSLQSIFSKYRFSKSRGISLTPVIVFDQFEEIFTLNENRNSAAVDKFFSDLSDILNNDTDSHNYRIVFCLREDYLYYIERLSESIPAFKRNRYCLQNLTHDEAMEIITLGGVETEHAPSVPKDVAEEILHKISPDNAEEYNATILSLYMSQLFDKMVKAGATTITSSLVQQFGDDIISAFYFDSIAGVSEKSIEYLEDHLVTTGGYRHNIPLEDAITAGVKQPEIDHLKDRRIINIQPRQGNILYMEYAHDVLCPIIVENRSERLLRKKNKRQRRLITAAVVGLLLVLGIMAGFIWQNYQIAQERDSMKLMQSRAIAGQAEIMLESGNYIEGAALCLRAFPNDFDNPDRPISYEAICALSSFMYTDFADCEWVSHSYSTCLSWYSPDGKHLAIVSKDSMVRIVNTSTGKIERSLVDSEGAFVSATFSPDGKYVAAGSGHPNKVTIWNIASGRVIKRIEGEEPVYSVSYTADGKQIVMTEAFKSIVIWDLAKDKCVKTIDAPKCAFASLSTDCRYLAYPEGESVVFYDLVKDKKRKISVGRYINNMCPFSFSADGKSVAIADLYGSALVMNVVTGKIINELKGSKGAVMSIDYSPDGKYIVTSSDGAMATVWNAETGEELRTLRGNGDHKANVEFCCDGTHLLTTWNYLGKGAAAIWNLSAEPFVKTINGVESNLNPYIFSPDGGQMVVTTVEGEEKIVSSQDGHLSMVMFNLTYGIGVCDIRSGEILKQTLLKRRVNPSALSPDGKFMVTTSYIEKGVKIWDVGTGEVIKTLEGYGNPLESAFFSPDGHRIVTIPLYWVNDTSGAVILDVNTGKHIMDLRAVEHSVWSAMYSNDGRYIVTSSGERKAIIWNSETGEKVRSIDADTSISSAQFSPDSRFVATTMGDHSIRIWSVASGKLIRTLKGHSTEIVTVYYSPDGHYIVSAAHGDDNARIWDVKSGKTIQVMKHKDINSSVFTPDGGYVVTSSDNNELKVWRLFQIQNVINHFRKVVGDYEFTEEEEIKYYLK